ncbi:unnamed protein product [Acanthoscelides obtectus]|uniref:Uncharacterized protein n=1 Tax=Acanthoscelides obtectus TaxID=200917 RepID=A0A9P0P1B2_ACAOB|nr:unnamed protein product [Acanthoscelides obtectus]CAK1629706.1 hypothetical protein AOBTE_LOCUS5907 [Acanthoscelides obtectus]
MGDTMPDFSNLFYNIEGDLLSERKKNFRKLLEIPCFKQNSEQLHRALADLKPRTYLEGLFKVDALIHFKRTEELLEILKEGNEVYMSKLLKQTWFIKEVFDNMTCHEFVNKFLPTMSYSFKIKFIKKMCLIWDEAKHDELFVCIFDRYGLPLAKTNLHKCSAEKIHKTLELYEIKLTSNQEKHLFDRSENIFLDYILHHNESESLSKYDEPKVIGYVALKNPGFLLELKQQNAFVLHTLGRRTTKKIFNIVKEDVKNNVDAHQKLLKNSVMLIWQCCFYVWTILFCAFCDAQCLCFVSSHVTIK